MNTLVILFADSKSEHIFDKCFNSLSAFDRSLLWAKKTCAEHKADFVLFCNNSIADKAREAINQAEIDSQILGLDNWTLQDLFSNMSLEAQKKNAKSIIFAYADQPLLNSELTDKIISDHIEYNAEYTFADGYLNGMSPEMLDAETAGILSKLAEIKEMGKTRVTRDSVFEFIKLDINSFEIETVIGEKDYKLFRINLNAESKSNLLCCQELLSKNIEKDSALEICEKASQELNCIKTVPSYYNIQISGKNNLKSIYEPASQSVFNGSFIDRTNFISLIDKIADFSRKAVVSLSLWGEALEHPDLISFVDAILSHPGLSVLIETDGQKVTEVLAQKINEICSKYPERTNGYEKILWIVKIDSATKEMYQKINGLDDGYDKAVLAVEVLSKYFAGSVYPQFTRINENEDELETFYRYWSNPQSPSKGKVIIQKYSTFCGVLPDKKPADLSPLVRNVCWHLRRDLNVLADGRVPLCREVLDKKIIGNAFTQDLNEIWKESDTEVKSQIKNNYSEHCGKCDEYYTFNF